MQINVSVTDANNIVCEVVPPQTQTITIDRGVAGNGIVSIVPVTISTFQYLRITYTNGTVQDVGPLTSTAYTATSPITIVGNTISLSTVPIASGGTGQTTAQAAMNSFAGAVTSGYYLRGNGTNVLMSAIQAADVPTLNQNTTGTAANITASSNSTLTTLSALSLPGSQVSGNISGNAANVTGTVAIGNGGTGQTTANAAFNALAPTQTGNSGKFLTTDGSNTSWATNPLGTVTSVAATVPSFLSISGSPITTSGTLAIGLSGTALPTANGGTGLTSFTANGVVYASSTSALATGSALTFDGTNLTLGNNPLSFGGGYTNLTVSGSSGGALYVTNTANTGQGFFGVNSSALQIGSQTNIPVAFYQNNSEQMRLTSTGLGIGTSSFVAKLTAATASASPSSVGSGTRFYETTNAYGLNIGANSSGYGWIQGLTGTTSTSGYNDLVLQPNGGNLGLGVTPQARLNVQYADSAPSSSGTMSTGAVFQYGAGGVALNMGTSSSGYAYFNSAFANNAGTGQAYRFYQGSTQAMTLDASGNLMVGTTTQFGSGQLCSLSSVNASAFRTTATANSYSAIYAGRNGNVGNVAEWWYDNSTRVGTVSITSVATLYNTTSDQRLKENIQDATSASDLIDSLQVRKFDWKADGSHQRYGFIAQELATVAPEAVYQPADLEEMMAVDYSKLVPMLVKEIQSLRKRLADAGIA